MGTVAKVTLVALIAVACYGDDLVFPKTKWSLPTDLDEITVALTITDSSLKVASPPPAGFGVRAPSPAELKRAIQTEIPFSSIAKISYTYTDRRRLLEGVLLSPGLLLTKSQSHWLVIEYGQPSENHIALLRLDSNDYHAVIPALNARTGKPVQLLDPNSPLVDPRVGSHDVDEVVPFDRASVAAAVKSAMDAFGCKPGKGKPNRIVCYRNYRHGDRGGVGGQEVLATIEAEGQGTRVKIATAKVWGGNWSTPIYQEMLHRLESTK